MKVGIMGGTFDPIHHGHLRAAEHAQAAAGLDAVLFVPAHVPPHRAEPAAAPHHRFAMVALATQGQASFAPCDIELRRDGPSFTVDTVRALQGARPGDTFTVILGSDAWSEVGSWREWPALRTMVSFVVVPRPGLEVTAIPGVTPAVSAPTGLAIASRDLRRALREGAAVADMVPGPVSEYIAKVGLYL